MRKYRIAGFVVLIVAVVGGASYYFTHRPSAIAMPVRVRAAPAPNVDIAERSSRPRSIARKIQTLASPTKSSGPSSPPSSLKDIFADLKSRADANDPEAASELYNDLARCQRTKELANALPKIIPSMLDRDTSKDSAEALQNRDKMLEGVEKELDYVQQNQSFCADLDDATLQDYVPSALKAAQLGDMQAARCYLGAALYVAPGLLDHPEWLSDYKQNAMSLADQGIQRGDWGIAALLGHAYIGTFAASFLSQMTGSDSLKAYQYLKLQRLGAGSELAKRLDGQLTSEAASLTPDQIAQGDAWAQDTYTQYFSGSGPNEQSKGVSACGSFDN